ncbi:hypothetical protein FJZ19_04385 [Candidatus Pacearchaeota archaeon]|nr:hypothetical protein [Candidatus Pacearchaeota archaeon]
MEIEELRKKAYKVIEDYNKKNSLQHDKEITFPHLVEEIGELAREIGHEKNGWRADFNKEKLAEELIDVLIQIMNLATDYNINIEETFNKKIEALNQRYGLAQ